MSVPCSFADEPSASTTGGRSARIPQIQLDERRPAAALEIVLPPRDAAYRPAGARQRRQWHDVGSWKLGRNVYMLYVHVHVVCACGGQHPFRSQHCSEGLATVACRRACHGRRPSAAARMIRRHSTMSLSTKLPPSDFPAAGDRGARGGGGLLHSPRRLVHPACAHLLALLGQRDLRWQLRTSERASARAARSSATASGVVDSEGESATHSGSVSSQVNSTQLKSAHAPPRASLKSSRVKSAHAPPRASGK
jgi:hypothetical protein